MIESINESSNNLMQEKFKMLQENGKNALLRTDCDCAVRQNYSLLLLEENSKKITFSKCPNSLLNKHCKTNSVITNTELNLPSEFTIAKSFADGNYFFDSYRQGLQQIGPTVSVEHLKNICKDFAGNKPPKWFIVAIKNISNQDGTVKRQSTEQYTKNILKRASWCDPDVEGRILCGYFNVTLYVVEKKITEDKNMYIYQEINKNGAKYITKIDYQNSNAIFMVNQGHRYFEPILFILPSVSDDNGIETVVGSTPAGEDSFYDSLRQTLQQIGHRVTVKSLRNICKSFAQNNPPTWFINATVNIKSGYSQNNYVRKETIQEYINNIMKKTRCGNPEVEGRIFCSHFKITLYVAYMMDMTYQRIDENGSSFILTNDITFQRNAKTNVWIISKRPGYFEPVLFMPSNNGYLNCNNTPITNNHEVKDDMTNMYSQKSVPIKKNKLKTNCRTNVNSAIVSAEKIFVFKTFDEIKNAIQLGNLEILKMLIKSIYVNYDKTLLSSIYYENSNPIRNTHLITLACKYKQSLILHFLLNESDILYYLPNKGAVVEKAYKQAFRETITSYNIKMLEMLYDYWSGDIHWPISDHRPATDLITNLKILRKQLIELQKSCQERLTKENPQMEVDVHCLICFNSFQIELYDKLDKSRIKITKSFSEIEVRKSEVESIKTVILNAFDIYKKFTEKNIRLTKHCDLDKNVLNPLIQSDVSVYMKYLIHCMYEIYYRKMDYNIALLIINNLHLLKQRLNLSKSVYENIESTLYYFLYRVNENWRLYLPENRKKPKQDKSLTYLIDGNRIFNGPVIYLEWVKFKKALDNFKTTLEHISVEENLRSKIPKDEINSLTSLPYMRDDYSLQKMLKYMGAITKVNFNQDKKWSLFIVQRVIHVVGEFMKHTSDSCHLSFTTKALLQAEIPKRIIKLIRDIRDDFSHARDGKLLCRINLETAESKLFEDLVDDIHEINKAIHEIIILYKPILEKSMIQTGLELIAKRFDELPEKASQYRYRIYKMYEIMCQYEDNRGIMMENKFVEEHWKKMGFTRQLFREIVNMGINYENLKETLCKKENKSIQTAIKKVPKYTTIILQTLNEMELHNNKWNSVKEDVGNAFGAETPILNNYPNKECFQKIKDALKKLNSRSTSNRIETQLKTLVDWSNDWNDITHIFNFFVHEVNILRQIKPCELTTLLEQDIAKAYPDADGISKAKKLIQRINDVATIYCQNQMLPIPEEETTYEYKQITYLSTKLKRNWFLTQAESNYLLKNIQFVCACTGDASIICVHCQISQKIQNNETLSHAEYKKIKSLNISEKCRKTVENLVIGHKRDSKMLECLVNRAEHLDALLGGCRNQNQLVLKYKNDESFRIVIEILIADIMNIFEEGWLKELVNVRFSKMLSELPLRNILAHGNAHLDVIGSVLDSNDLPKAIISFALHFIEDEKYLKDLYTLYEDEADRHDVYWSTNLKPEQLKLVDSFKACPKWKSYIKLLPTKKQGANQNKQNRAVQ